MDTKCVNCLWHELIIDEECVCTNDKASEEETHNAYCSDEYYISNLGNCRYFSKS